MDESDDYLKELERLAGPCVRNGVSAIATLETLASRDPNRFGWLVGLRAGLMTITDELRASPYLRRVSTFVVPGCP